MLNAKLAYLLSTCHKFSDSFFSAMIKRHKNVATMHNFVLFVDLYEPDSSNEFMVKNVYFKFAGNNDSVIAEALQLNNNKILSPNEMNHIYNNLVNLNLKLSPKNLVAVYTIASLIKLYEGRGFNYIFVPVVINYGRNANLMHQTALILNYEGYDLYYEPYGKYEKFYKSYKKCMCELFTIFNNVKCITYHDNIPVETGIQNIIMEKNNVQVYAFNIKFNNLINKLKIKFPDKNFEFPEDMQDKTYKIVDVLYKLDRMNTNGELHSTNQEYEELLNQTLQLYCMYNSKTCVSITLVELDRFFFGNPIPYREFNVLEPNYVLMGKLYLLFNKLKKSDKTLYSFNNIINSTDICKSLFPKYSSI